MRDPKGGGYRVRSATVALLTTFAMLAAIAPAANAAFGITNLSAQPANTAAGANSDFSIGFDIQDPGAQMKDLVIHLPPGLIGNPLATPTCREAQLNADNCPAASDVGDLSNDVLVHSLPVPVPVTASGNVYNVVPRQGEPARFGFVLKTTGGLLPPIILQSPASLRQSDFGLDTTLNNLPNSVTIAGLPVSIDITAVDLTLKGKVGSPAKGFLRNPTSCGSHTVSINADSYDAQTATASTTFNTNNCAAQPFSPKFSARIHERSTNPLDPVEMSTTISQTIQEAGLKRAVVTLPKEVIGNGPALAIQCTISDFNAGNCADDTIVGSATAASPLQSQPLTGNVYLINPAVPGPFPDLGVDLKGGLALKVVGSLSATPDFQIFVTFDGLPDIPLSEFTLTFADGPDGLNLLSRSACSPPPLVFNADFLGQSGQTLNTNINPDVTCDGSSSGKPKAKVTLAKLKSGHPALGLKLKAGAAKIRSAKVSLPRGLRVGARAKLKHGTRVKGGSARGRGHKLTLKAKGGGVDLIKGSFSKGAIVAGKGLKAKRLKPFKIKIRDADGKTTTLSVHAK